MGSLFLALAQIQKEFYELWTKGFAKDVKAMGCKLLGG